VQEVFVDDNGSSFWNNKEQHNKPTNILQTTIGYESLLYILRKILLKDTDKDVFDKQLYMEYLTKAKSIDIKDENNPQKYPFTNKAKKIFIDDLCRLIFDETEK
jgi:hypothetical protein